MGALNVGEPAVGSAGATVPVGRRPLGSQGPVVSDQGLGCMGLHTGEGPDGHAEAVATVDRALELGISFFDTADVYVVPIPGTKRRRTLDENVGALAVRLDVEELARLDGLAARVVGDRSINPEAVGREAPLPAATRR